jgi:hypothetical protein
MAVILSCSERRTGYYDLKLGPAPVNLSAHLDLEYHDNIDLSETERKSDLIIRPSFYANILWQIGEVNALRLNLGVGYIKYLRIASSIPRLWRSHRSQNLPSTFTLATFVSPCSISSRFFKIRWTKLI